MAGRQMDTYGHEEMAIPQWKLIQNVGADYAKSLGAQPGDFYCSLTDDIVKKLEIVVVDIRKQRTYWGRTDIEEAPPECSSTDGITSLDGKDCASCQYRCDTPWSMDSTERRQMCTLSYNILCINTADHLPCLIRAGGINALPTRQLLTLLRLNKNLKGEYHRALVEVTSVKKKTSAGEAYAIHFKMKSLLTGTQADELKEQSLQLLGAPISLPEAEEEEPIAFTPEGKPIHSEEEKEKLLAQATTVPATDAPPAAPPASAKQTEPTKEEGKKESNKKELDLDF